MFYIKALTLSILLAAAPMKLNEDQIIQRGAQPCPDGTLLEVVVYDTNPDNPEAMTVEFKRTGKQVGVIQFPERKLYVTLTGQTYDLNVENPPYPSPCELPVGTDT